MNQIKQGWQLQGHMLIKVRKEEAGPAVPSPCLRPAPQGPRKTTMLLGANVSWW